LAGQDVKYILYFVLTGFIGFFIFERSATWFHQHHEHPQNRDKTHGKLIITGNILHNAIDGVALGAAFLVDIPTGVITTIAIAAHEIPKEIAEFGLLLAKGYSNRKTLAMNIAAALATLITTIGVFILGKSEPVPVAPLLGLTAGFFIYIAASDIIPDIHEQPKRLANIQTVMLLLGIMIVGAAILLAAH
ncbi:MAG TPA: ZIP family metal transporter, partial [Candidatus Saccharimonadales bacterium]|nr:ZIP family metal transporter [Candidatus Saccharimonadales bacterium]